MADSEIEEGFAAAPGAGEMLERAGAAWLAPLRERLATLQEQGRLPHGLLLAGSPGAGQAELGAWLAARLLCRAPGAGRCGECADCQLFTAGSHPDFRWVGLLPDRKEIGIEQIRSLSGSLSLRSYRGGSKVALIGHAQVMNAKAFNALLKTLEEPVEDTYLLLATSRIDRVPKTILSRCLRLRLPLPAASESLAWLGRFSGTEDWAALLALAGGAPFLAVDYANGELGGLDAEMAGALAAATNGKLDWIAFADACAKNSPAARLVWLESWLTRSLKEAALASDLVNNNRLPWLRPPGLETKIRAGYGLLDQLRDARRLLGGNLNAQLLFEGLSISLVALVGPAAGRAGE